MALVAERKKSSVRVFDLIQVGPGWKLRKGREDVVVGDGRAVVKFLRELPREESRIRMSGWECYDGESGVVVSKAIARVNFADWGHAS
jgi:hypothetical protein